MNNIVTVRHDINEPFLQQWQQLWDESAGAHFFNAPQWFLACIKSFNIQKYAIITVEKNGKFEAILPLVYEKQLGIPLLCSPGERFVDKSSLLVRNADKSLLRDVANTLTELGNFYLQELDEDLANALAEGHKHMLKQPSSINYYLLLDGDPLQFMSNKMRNQTRNRIKKHEEHLTFKHFRGDLEGLEMAFELDKRSSKRKQGKSTFVRQRERDFFQQLLTENGRNFTVDILFYDNKPIIYGIGFIAKQRYQACITAYDDEYSFLSPGKMLHFYMFPHLQEDGVTLFDFSRGVTVLKKEFTQSFKVQYDIFYVKNSFMRIWWKTINKSKHTILENKLLYGMYLSFKKRLYR